MLNHHGRPCHSSDGYSISSHYGGQGSNPALIMWNLWWSKWRWNKFSPSTSVFLANFHSTNCSNSGRSTKWTQPNPTNNNNNNNNNNNKK
jgi:hypothetical protein